MSEDKKPEYYHDVEIEKIDLTSKFRHKGQNFDGIIPGYPSTLKLKLKNIGERTFEGGDVHCNITTHKERGSGTRISGGGGGGIQRIAIPEIKPNKSRKLEREIEFPNNEDSVEIRAVNIVSKNHVPTMIRGNKLLAPKITPVEDAKSEIFRKTIAYITLAVVIATLVSTIGFSLWSP